MKAGADLEFGGSGTNAVPSNGVRPGNGHIGCRSAEQDAPHQHTRGATPAEPAKSSVSTSQDRARLRNHPGSLCEMQVSRPRRWHSSHRCKVGPRLWYFLKTSQVILTQALHGNPQRILGAMGLQGLSPELRDAGRSAREPRQGWAIPTPQQQRVRRGRPGEELEVQDSAADTCLHLLPGAGAAPTWPRSPRYWLPGGALQHVLTGAEAMGGAVGSRLLPVGETGKGGDGGEGGTVRRPEPSVQSGGASRSLQQRRPSQTPRSRRGQPSPEAPRARETARPQHAGRRDAPGSYATTHQNQWVLTLALPRLDPKEEGSN